VIKEIIEEQIRLLFEEKRFLETLQKYVESSEDYYIHFTNVYSDIKMQLNPLSEFNTPLGIYAYPLNQKIFHLLKNQSLPFASERKYLIVFSIKPEYQDKVFVVNENEVSDSVYLKQKSELQKLYDFEKEKRERVEDIFGYLNKTSRKVIDYFSKLDTKEFFSKLDKNSQLSFQQIDKKIGNLIHVEENENALQAIQFREVRDKINIDVVKRFYAFVLTVVEIYESVTNFFEKYFTLKNSKKEIVQFLWDKGDDVVRIILGEQNLNSLNLEEIYKKMLEEVESSYIIKTKQDDKLPTTFAKTIKDLESDTNLTKIWTLSRYVALQINLEQENKRFNLLWRNLLIKLGYLGIVDPGYGLIHKNEPEQAVFFITKMLKTDEILENKYAINLSDYSVEL